MGSLPEVTELVNGRTRIRTQAGWLQKAFRVLFLLLECSTPVVVHALILVATVWSEIINPG